MADIVAAGLVAPGVQRVLDGNVHQLTKVVEILIADDGKALLSGGHDALLVSQAVPVPAKADTVRLAQAGWTIYQRRLIIAHSLEVSSTMAAPKMFDLSGEVAVVTGGNGGIGRGIALGLAEAGASVAILARNEEKNRAVVEELTKAGVPALAIQLDVTRRDDLRPAMEEAERKLGPISILVNN